MKIFETEKCHTLHVFWLSCYFYSSLSVTSPIKAAMNHNFRQKHLATVLFYCVYDVHSTTNQYT